MPSVQRFWIQLQRATRPGWLAPLLTVFVIVFGSGRAMGTNSIIVGKVRVQLLSESLVRLELKGPEGFENRTTFHIVNRNWPGVACTTNLNAGDVVVRTADYTVRVPENAGSLDGVQVESSDGHTLYRYDGKLENSRWLPAPADHPQVWSFADTPRIIPPTWGLTPESADTHFRSATSGWDLSNNAPDIYVFIPDGSYRRLRHDFLELTGPTEMPPLFALGAFDSRWYNYTEATALQQIDDYRAHQIPLDVLVMDTGWRKGASSGYEPNTNLLPNLPRLFKEAHAKHVRVMFNDHPSPVSKESLAPAELQYRYNGLSGLLKEGLDIWWYDRNWYTALVTPAPNLRKEVWGMRLYHDMTLRAKPGLRPLIMANVDGVDSGYRNGPPDVAAHRFPIQWTGDVGPGYDFLRRAVENAVYEGVHGLFPYESDDLGGHVADPSSRGYIRWIEYGALSPVYRPHCTFNHTRMPWTFGSEAENIARRFLDMRYRLLPVFYAAAHQNYETGVPLLRRLDLYYPRYPQARRNDEYLLGKDILVAPIVGGRFNTVPADWLETTQGEPGLLAEYFSNDSLRGSPTLTRTDKVLDFDWGYGNAGPNLPDDHFSARWTGILHVPQSVGDIVLAASADDGVRVWVDGRLMIDAWGAHSTALTKATVALSSCEPHQLRVEYQEQAGAANVQLEWRPALSHDTDTRGLWIPPGSWMNVWTGNIITGPLSQTNQVSLGQLPIFVKGGAILPLAPQMEYTGQKPWNPVTLDLYPQTGVTNRTMLYEDDTETTAYREGKFRQTIAVLSADEASRTVQVTIGAAVGHFPRALRKRSWTLRIHHCENWPADLVPVSVKINGKKCNAPIRRLESDRAAMPFGDALGAPDGDVFEINLPSGPVTKSQDVQVTFAHQKNG